MYRVSHFHGSIGLCGASACMFELRIPRSQDRKERITEMANKIARLLRLGLNFVGPFHELGKSYAENTCYVDCLQLRLTAVCMAVTSGMLKRGATCIKQNSYHVKHTLKVP
jgi:hypothetical protein